MQKLEDFDYVKLTGKHGPHAEVKITQSGLAHLENMRIIAEQRSLNRRMLGYTVIYGFVALCFISCVYILFDLNRRIDNLREGLF